jgi:hypothetical protein
MGICDTYIFKEQLSPEGPSGPEGLVVNGGVKEAMS